MILPSCSEPDVRNPALVRRRLRRPTAEQRRRFLAAVGKMVDDMKAGRAFRPGLRIRRVQGTRGVWEVRMKSGSRDSMSAR
jgi:hypothetical protein